MIPQLNILSVVDVIGALRSGSLDGKLFMVDNSPANHAGSGVGGCVPSSGLGTDTLATGVRFAQVLNWHVLGIDFQTDVQIQKISFFQGGQPITAAGTPCVRLGRYGAPSGEYWAGVVNFGKVIRPGEYQYLIEFNVNGRRMTMEKYARLIVSA